MIHVLDSSVVLAAINREPGADVATEYVFSGIISAVNLAEVVTKLTEFGMSAMTARDVIAELGPKVVGFDADAAHIVGMLRMQTRAFGLSLGDRACLALAMREKLPVVTTDRAWRNVDVGVEIRVIR